MKTAIILGATGLTGSILLQKLLADDRYEKLKLFSRSASKVKNPKIEEHLGDLFQIEKFKDDFTADEVYVCVATTQKKTPDKETYHKIDYGIPVNAAKLTKDNGISTFCVISALGADENSRFFYNKTKGEMERDVLNQKIPQTYIFEPSMIRGDREENRPMESFGQKAMKFIDPLLIGGFKKYRSIKAESIAEAMLTVANQNFSKSKIHSEEIKQIASA